MTETRNVLLVMQNIRLRDKNQSHTKYNPSALFEHRLVYNDIIQRLTSHKTLENSEFMNEKHKNSGSIGMSPPRLFNY